MTRTGIADLKANLSAYLRRVRNGETITVMDRETPVARIVAAEQTGRVVRVRQARAPLSGLQPPRRLRSRVDPLEALMEERDER